MATLDRLKIGRLVLFKGQPSGFEFGHFGLDIVNYPACLCVRSAGSTLAGKEQKAAIFTTAVEQASAGDFALWGQPQLFSIEKLARSRSVVGSVVCIGRFANICFTSFLCVASFLVGRVAQ